jgi:hypothetical protein
MLLIASCLNTDCHYVSGRDRAPAKGGSGNSLGLAPLSTQVNAAPHKGNENSPESKPYTFGSEVFV